MVSKCRERDWACGLCFAGQWMMMVFVLDPWGDGDGGC